MVNKEYLKIYGIRIGSANSELLEMYCKKKGIKTHHQAARRIVEDTVLGHKIRSTEDVETAKNYAENMLFNSLSDIVEQMARREVQKELNICQNCSHFNIDSCDLNNIKVSAYSNGCLNMDKET